MNLQNLVDELRNNILFDRSDSTSGDPDKLWSDATLVRYINEAQRRFARRAFVIRDATTPETCNVALVAGQTDYVLHPAVLAILSARLEDTRVDLARFGHTDFATNTSPAAMLWDPGAVTMPSGRTLAFATDEQLSEDDDGTISVVTMRVYPEPRAADAGTIIKLRVVRLPLDDLTASSMSAVPEIPIDHHLDMLDWAAYLALRIMDVDAGNIARAEKFAASFEAHVHAARNLVLKKLFSPQQWGFGRGGWSWGNLPNGY